MKEMNKSTFKICLMIFGLLLSINLYAQDNNADAVKTTPNWITKIPQGYVFTYHVGIGESTKSLPEAKKSAIAAALGSAVQSGVVHVTAKLDSSKEATVSAEGKANFISRVTEEVTVKGFSTEIKGLAEVENYPETVIRDGSILYRIYVLIRVPKQEPDESPGAFGFFARSALAPGWAQLIKGHKTKGVFIASAQIVTVAAAISTGIYWNAAKNEAQKATKSIDKEYWNDEINIYYPAFIISTALAGSVYLYNILDAVLAEDSLHMAAIPTNEGFYLSMNFKF